MKRGYLYFHYKSYSDNASVPDKQSNWQTFCSQISAISIKKSKRLIYPYQKAQIHYEILVSLCFFNIPMLKTNIVLYLRNNERSNSGTSPSLAARPNKASIAP